jgi:hypothetical protein
MITRSHLINARTSRKGRHLQDETVETQPNHHFPSDSIAAGLWFPCHKTIYEITSSSNSLFRERNAQSSARPSTSRHVRFRAVPRTNRTLTTANTRIHSATSSTTGSPACVPSLPWRCFCADALPGACTDVSSPDGYALLLGPPLPARSATTNCLAC